MNSVPPLRRKDQLGDNDVVGHGVLGSKKHPGNVKYRKLVAEKCKDYIIGTKQQKDNLVDDIKKVCGDFVFKRKADGPDGPWYVHNLTKRNDTIRNALNSKANEAERKQNRKRRRLDQQPSVGSKLPNIVEQPSDQIESIAPVVVDSNATILLQQTPPPLQKEIAAPEKSILHTPVEKIGEHNLSRLEVSYCRSPLDVLSLVSSVKQALLLKPAHSG